jgi:hypothetical protein
VCCVRMVSMCLCLSLQIQCGNSICMCKTGTGELTGIDIIVGWVVDG